MSAPQSPITYEQMMALFLENREQMKETERILKESTLAHEARLKALEEERLTREQERKEREEKELQERKEREEKELQERKEREKKREHEQQAWNKYEKKMNRKFAEFGDRIGDLIQAMVRGGVLRLFQELGYSFENCSLGNVEFRNPTLGIHGEVDLFIENGDVALLVEVKTKLSVDDVKYHLERLEKYRRYANARGDKRRFIAAAGGGVIPPHVREFALQHGLYVIQQSGRNVEVIPPEGEPRVW